MKPNWIDLGALADLPAGEPVLRKGDGRRYVCVLQEGKVSALDDLCPHQGYPLSQGSVRDGVLTCDWHNWKFDLETGDCRFGGEPVRCYPTRIENGRVLLNDAIDTPAEARRLVGSLRAALRDDQPSRALREGIRLGELGISPPGEKLGALYMAFELVAKDGAERARYGFDHALAMLADLSSWAERGVLPAEEAFLVASTAVGEACANLGRRGASKGEQGQADPRALLMSIMDVKSDDPALVSESLTGERREEAEVRIRLLLGPRGTAGARAALLPFVCRHVYDYGHGAIFLAKALELATRFPTAATETLAAVTVQLSWATAETSLPPFAATRAAQARLAETALPEPGREIAWDRGAYEAEVLAGEAQAAAATVARLAEGCDPVALLRAVAHAAAVRLGRFDDAWERRLDSEVGVLDVTHAVTFAEAAISLGVHASRREAAQLALLAAAFVGKLRHGDGAAPVMPTASSGPSDLLAAVAARDVGRALHAARDMDGPARLATYDKLAPFAALDAATRPIFIAHTVKNTEALRRLEASDPQADGAYLRALLTYMVPIRAERSVRRAAAVARKFLQDGRPPEGLY
jgi:nitrite reductase/ring-hydroxylating ferredoxin subunit